MRPHEPHPGRAPVGAIIGAVLGGLCILCGFAVLFWLYHRSRGKSPSIFGGNPDSAPALVPSVDLEAKDGLPDPVPYPVSTVVNNSRHLPPSPKKRRFIPISPPHSIHGGSTVTSGFESPPQSPAPAFSSFDAASAKLVSKKNPNRENAKVFTRPRSRRWNRLETRDKIREEIRRLREELASLRRDVTKGKLTFNTYSRV